MDLFLEKNVKPMLIEKMQEPFDDPEWIYELKLDGIRCVAYLVEGRTILRNKRIMELLPRFPELQGCHEQVREKCVLDGELVVMVNGVPDFYELQKRTMLTSKSRIEMGAGRFPASFVAYDCMQAGRKVLFGTPLMERKQILSGLVMEKDRFALSRYIEEKGTRLFQMTVEKKLEGVVAKRASSLYYPDKRTKDWIKFKRMADREFVICGYETGKMTSLILGEYEGGELRYAGTVTMGVRREITRILKTADCPFRRKPKDKENVIWCKPDQVCTVEYMPNTLDALRQPVFKGLRDDL